MRSHIPRGARLLQGLSLHPPSVGLSDRPVRAPGTTRPGNLAVQCFEQLSRETQSALAHASTPVVQDLPWCGRGICLSFGKSGAAAFGPEPPVLENSRPSILPGVALGSCPSAPQPSLPPLPSGHRLAGRPRVTGNAGNLQRASAIWAIEHDGHAHVSNRRTVVVRRNLQRRWRPRGQSPLLPSRRMNLLRPHGLAVSSWPHSQDMHGTITSPQSCSLIKKKLIAGARVSNPYALSLLGNLNLGQRWLRVVVFALR